MSFVLPSLPRRPFCRSQSGVALRAALLRQCHVASEGEGRGTGAGEAREVQEAGDIGEGKSGGSRSKRLEQLDDINRIDGISHSTSSNGFIPLHGSTH